MPLVSTEENISALKFAIHVQSICTATNTNVCVYESSQTTNFSDEFEDKDSISDVNGEDDGVLGALSGRGPQANGVHGAFSFTPGNLGFGHTGKTSSGKDAHMAYLMLRHLKLRHIRRSVSCGKPEALKIYFSPVFQQRILQSRAALKKKFAFL